MAEIKWEKINNYIFYTFFQKMHILKVYEPKNPYEFIGCYIMNLQIGKKHITKYHFFSYNFIYDAKRFKQMCILPNSLYNSNYKNLNYKNDQIINEKIILWFKNNCKFLKYNVDVLGHDHIVSKEENKFFFKNQTWENVKKVSLYSNDSKKSMKSKKLKNNLKTIFEKNKIYEKQINKIISQIYKDKEIIDIKIEDLFKE